MKILYIDKDIVFRDYVKMFLETGYEAEVIESTAHNEAVFILDMDPDSIPDLIFCDIEQGVNKTSLVDYLAEKKLDIPILWVVKKEDEKDELIISSLKNNPNYDILIKPFKENELIPILEKLMQSAGIELSSDDETESEAKKNVEPDTNTQTTQKTTQETTQESNQDDGQESDLKIFYIDKDIVFRDYVKMFLETGYDAEVIESTAHNEAVFILDMDPDSIPDLIFCDIEQGVNKTSLVDYLAEKKLNIPILWIVKKEDEKDELIVNSLKNNPNYDIVIKPFKENDLIPILENLLSKIGKNPEDSTADSIEKSTNDTNQIENIKSSKESKEVEGGDADWSLTKESKEVEGGDADWSLTKESKEVEGGDADWSLAKENKEKEGGDADWSLAKENKEKEGGDADWSLAKENKEKEGGDADWSLAKENKEKEGGDADWSLAKEDKEKNGGDADWSLVKEDKEKNGGDADWSLEKDGGGLQLTKNILNEDEIIYTEDREYIGIQINEFLKLSSTCCDIYIKLSAVKFLKFINQNDLVDHQRIESYIKKKIAYLYIKSIMKDSFQKLLSSAK